MSARDDLANEYGRAEEAPLGTLTEFRRKLDAVREEMRREILGDDLNPSSLVLDAQAYRRLRDAITATMDDPDRWDQDGDEGSILSDYVQWLADGKPARDDGWEDDAAPARQTLPDVLRGAADRIDAEDVPQTAEDTADFVDGVRWATGQLRAIAGEAGTAPDNTGWLPDWLVELARECAVSFLNSAERAMLRYALELTEDKMLSEGDEFTAVDHAAVASLKQLAGEAPAEPAYIEDREYQIVGDWGVDGADSEDEARADVAKALRVHPACGAYAEQRVVRTWPDGSEFYGPWTRLPESG
ncbi:hypothetical protein ACW7N6_38375 [Streptomyces sp. UC1A3]